MGSFARSTTSWVFAVWLGVTVAACGGGGGGGAPNPNPNPSANPPVDIEIPSTAALDGWCSAQGHTSTTGGLLVGDLDASWDGLGYRSFLSFDLGAIPAGATITYARLDVYKVQTFGSPFTHHGKVMAYQVDYGDTIELADFNSAGSFGTILSESVIPGWRTCVQLGAVQQAWVLGAGRVQFRIQCRDLDSDADQIDDGFWFDDSENFWLSGHAPTLRVTYTPP